MDLTPFQNYLSINLGKESTICYFYNMKSFFKHYEEFNQENINAYLASKVDKWGAATFNKFLKAVKWYMKFSKIVVELPKSKKEEARPRPYLKEKEIYEILNDLSVIFKDAQKIKIIFELMFCTGLRPKELFTLKREHINLDEGVITLINTKTHFCREAFLTKDLTIAIRSYFGIEKEVDNAFNISDTSLGYYCSTISKHTKIKITPYMIRHTYAHLYLKNTKNNTVGLSQMLGHKDLKTTQIYCSMNKKELKEIYLNAFKNQGKKWKKK